MKPKYPIYDTFNFQMKGYDFPILESYQKFVHSVADSMDLDVAESWATPPQHLQVQRFKPQSSVIETEYKLTVYERNIQIADMQAPILPLFVRLIQTALPEGVTLSVLEQNDEEDEKRYMPDKDLMELKAQLDDLGGPTISSKKK